MSVILWIFFGVIVLLVIAVFILMYKMHWFFIFFGKVGKDVGKITNNFIKNKISAKEYKDGYIELITDYDKKERKKIRKTKLDKINKSK